MLDNNILDSDVFINSISVLYMIEAEEFRPFNEEDEKERFLDEGQGDFFNTKAMCFYKNNVKNGRFIKPAIGNVSLKVSPFDASGIYNIPFNKYSKEDHVCETIDIWDDTDKEYGRYYIVNTTISKSLLTNSGECFILINNKNYSLLTIYDHNDTAYVPLIQNIITKDQKLIAPLNCSYYSYMDEEKVVSQNKTKIQIFKKEQETVNTLTNYYITDDLNREKTIEKIRENCIDISNFQIEEGSDIETKRSQYSNADIAIPIKDYFSLKFSEKENSNSLYNAIISREKSRFKISKLIELYDGQYILDEYRDCVLVQKPTLKEDGSANIWEYEFRVYDINKNKQ